MDLARCIAADSVGIFYLAAGLDPTGLLLLVYLFDEALDIFDPLLPILYGERMPLFLPKTDDLLVEFTLHLVHGQGRLLCRTVLISSDRRAAHAALLLRLF